MDEKNIQHIFIEILYATVNEAVDVGRLREALTQNCLRSVYRLAKQHDLAHVVARFVDQNRIAVDQDLQAELKRAEILAVYRQEQMQYAYREIVGALEEAKLAYVPLKGSVIRPYYPYESMRTSCDIDILIREQDLDTAIRSLTGREYRCGERNYHDVSLYSPGGVHLELHFNIQENMERLDAVLKHAWQYAEPSDGCCYAFSKEFFAFHLLAHMAYHFVSGGCGIRALLDIWVMEHRMGISCSCADALLAQAKLERFAAEMCRVAEQCFTYNTIDDWSDTVLTYIFQGGVYGSADNQIAVEQSKSNGTVGYALKRFFLPYRSMTVQYPILKKAPILLPFCWGARGFGAVFGGKSHRIAAELSIANQLSDERIDEIQALCTRLGL